MRPMRRRWLVVAAAPLLVVLLAGFAPFDNEGLAILRVAGGSGEAPVDPDQDDGELKFRQLETQALFHSLSSRFGGGGTLIYIEHTPDAEGISGVLILDLRHAGLPDLESSLIDVPNRRRVEPFYQEWAGTNDLFASGRAFGEIQILDMYRGQRVSAIAVEFDLIFLAPGPDGTFDTDDDVWRRVEGRATTSPTVAQAVELEPEVVFERRRTGRPFAPEGDVYVTCTGDVYVEEEEFDEDSFTYEDDDGGGCGGDTWEDDSANPQESGGCAAETAVDDGEPDPDGGCEGDGGDLDDEDFANEDDPFFEDDDAAEDGSGCDEGTSDDTSSDDDGGAGCDPDLDEPDDTSTDDSDDDDDDDSVECAGDTDPVEAAIPPGQRALARQYLLTPDPASLRKAPRPTRAQKQARRTARRILNHLPFIMLGLVIHLWRRRGASAPSLATPDRRRAGRG